MNRNITIVIALLLVVVIAGYLVWLRSKVSVPVSPKVEVEVQVVPTAVPTATASASAALGKEATTATKAKNATTSPVRR